jgi:hypothetical protein
MGRPAIALVPGFLGFDHLGSTSYFADRFTAGLSGVLAGLGRGGIPIFPLHTLPIGNLAARQTALALQLDALDASRDTDWHLVGHSTGGLDAALLARGQKLVYDGKKSVFSREAWGPKRIKSVTTLSAPHFGTGLSLAPLPAMTHRRFPTKKGLFDLAHGAVDVLVGRDALLRRAGFALATTFEANSPKFAIDLFSHDMLAGDLDPRVTTPLTLANNRRGVPVYSIAAMAPAPGPRPPDKLFRDLWHWTREGAAGVPPPPPPPGPPGAIVAALPGILPTGPGPIDVAANDGVVNTGRMIDPMGTYSGLVLADHADVVGSYQRKDERGHLIEPGLLTSGAEFGDAQFTELLSIVARGIR